MTMKPGAEYKLYVSGAGSPTLTFKPAFEAIFLVILLLLKSSSGVGLSLHSHGFVRS